MPDVPTNGDQEKLVDLVFQGGGVKGIALVGAYAVLEEQGYKAQNVAGASAGAIVASLIAAGYTAAELFEVLSETPFASFMDPNWEEKLKPAGALLAILRERGMYKGEFARNWIHDKLAAKKIDGRSITTFGDLRNEGETDPRWMYKLQVVVSDLTHHSVLLLPRDAAVIGVDDPDELSIADAVRMSMSIPFFFEPVARRGPDGEVILVDGGMLSNFPVWIFDSDGVPDWPTFGLKLVNPNPSGRPKGGGPSSGSAPHLEAADPHIKKLAGLLHDLVSTMTDAHDKLYLERDAFVRTITISNLGVKTTEFTLPEQTVQALHQSGRDATEDFLKTWDFDAYKRSFRSGQPQPSRREAVVERMGR